MTKRRIIADTISAAAALGAAGASMYVSVRYLAPPKGLTDWTIQITGATTAGIFAFFLVWGHFQEIPLNLSSFWKQPSANSRVTTVVGIWTLCVSAVRMRSQM